METVIKRITITGLLLAMLLLMGCGDLPVYHLTDEEMEEVAEYSAGVLLRRDKNYQQKLMSMKELTPTPEPTAAVSSAPTPTSAPSSGAVTGQPVAATPTPTPTPAPSLTLAQVLGNAQLSVVGVGYELLSEYSYAPGVMSLTPQKRENQLLVVLFEASNPTETVQGIDVLGADPKITLQYGSDQSVSARMTMLENDFQYLSQDVSPGQTLEGILVFEVPRDIEMTGARLSVRSSVGLYYITLE